MSVTATTTQTNNFINNRQYPDDVTISQNNQTDTEKTSGDYQDFLLLLTTQMKNQDPLQPLDSTNFVSQLAQFSNVEQQVKMNSKLDNLVTSLSKDSFAEAGGYLGKYIMADGGKTYVQADDTKTSFQYQTDANVKSISAEITDRFGNAVNTISLPLAPNGRSHEWNLENMEEEKVEQGLYNISLKIVDKDDNIAVQPAQTKVQITEARKTETGFEYLTNTGSKLTPDDIKSLLAS